MAKQDSTMLLAEYTNTSRLFRFKALRCSVMVTAIKRVSNSMGTMANRWASIWYRWRV